MALVTPALHATRDFVARYANLFEQGPHVPGVGQHITLRKGAPVLQMLEAPDDFVEGSAEPWIVNVLCALVRAGDYRSLLETGAFVGSTTERLARTLAEMGGGRVVACELDPTRAQRAFERLERAALPPTVEWHVVQDDVLRYLASVPDGTLDFVWVDDAHEHWHVARELEMLLGKVRLGGLVCGHDVFGSTALHEEFARFGGYALDLPRLGPAGGLGLLQVR